MPEISQGRGASAIPRGEHDSLNQAFTQFLGIGTADAALLRRYLTPLLEGGEDFARVFYEYLLSYPATAQLLERFAAAGGRIGDLARAQLQHFRELLSAATDQASAQRLIQIGQVHYRFGIQPVWVMGAYRLYWEHLHAIVSGNPAIAPADRAPLAGAIAKLLFRDMGLMLEGYWDSATLALHEERRAVEELQERITGLLGNIPQILWSVDAETHQLLYLSPMARRTCDAELEMPIPCLSWTLAEDRPLVEQAWRRALSGEQAEVETRVSPPGGEQRWLRRVFQPYRDAAGRVVRIDGLMEDATENRRAVEHLHTLATTDSLTGLYNRAVFHARVNEAIHAAERAGRQLVLMLMDLDRFKEINDTLGHLTGDEMLRMVARRLPEALRRADTLARLGGDEFAVLLEQTPVPELAAERVAEQLLACFGQPFACDGHELHLGVSIGIAVYPAHGRDVDSLMSRADAAMYAAKRRASGYAFYDTDGDPHASRRPELESELRRALDAEEFVLRYQPRIDLRSGQVSRVEVLLHWQHPQRGLLSPEHFISVADNSGLIGPITDWVFATAARESRAWRQTGSAPGLAFSVAGRALHRPGLLAGVRGLMGQPGNPPGVVELAITEDALMGDIARAAQVLDPLTASGVRIAVDRYGTGQSSLPGLQRLPLSALKIDRSFVNDLGRIDSAGVTLRAMIELAHNLGYEAVAEGVQTQVSVDLLSGMGCDLAQGVHIADPMDVTALVAWLNRPG